MAASMSGSFADIAKLLNLNQADSDAFSHIVTDYFASDGNCDSSDEDISQNSDDDNEPPERNFESFVPVTPDLAESIVPVHRGQPQELTEEANSVESGQATVTPAVAGDIPCSCVGKPCYSVFTTEQIEDFRMQYLALDRNELDIALLAKIACGIHLDEETRNSKNSKQTERKSSRTDYTHHGHKICRNFFKYLHSIGQDKLSALMKHYKANGVEARMHKNKKKLPKKALQYDDTRRVVDFIINYAEVHAIHLPGRTPNHWVTDIQLLPTNSTKVLVYNDYKISAESSNVRVVKLRTFQHLWKTLVPFIKTMPPASDLCWTCQQGASRLLNTARDFSQAMEELQQHQIIVKREREFYIELCNDIKKQTPETIALGRHPPCSFNGKAHVSFDFAQQMHYPHDPRQPGPIYFKTPRKCGLFGLNNESMKVQMNYLIDEAHTSGKGANVVISYLHDYLENHGLGESDLYLHADNCAGQNKNSAMIWYLTWRCVTGRHKKIHLSFLITGHTKFSPDGGFGLIKRKLKVSRVDCLDDIVNVVNSSAQMNQAKLVGTEQGPTKVPTFNWSSFLSEFFVKVKAIKSFQHFSVDQSGSLRVKEYIDSAEQVQPLLRKQPPADKLPPVIPAEGLSTQRQWYLYQDIRPFVADAKRDIVTPLPAVQQHQLVSSDSESDNEDYGNSNKRQRLDQPTQQNSRGRGRGRGRGQNKQK